MNKTLYLFIIVSFLGCSVNDPTDEVLGWRYAQHSGEGMKVVYGTGTSPCTSMPISDTAKVALTIPKWSVLKRKTFWFFKDNKPNKSEYIYFGSLNNNSEKTVSYTNSDENDFKMMSGVYEEKQGYVRLMGQYQTTSEVWDCYIYKDNYNRYFIRVGNEVFSKVGEHDLIGDWECKNGQNSYSFTISEQAGYFNDRGYVEFQYKNGWHTGLYTGKVFHYNVFECTRTLESE